MGETFYAQSEHRASTLTVGQLIERLQRHDPNAPVIFQSPRFGAFGSETMYSIECIDAVAFEHDERVFPASTSIDEETGEQIQVEAWTEVWHAWHGVVVR